MALTDQRHTVRLPLPDLIVRGASHTLYAPVYLDGKLVAPASATVSVYNRANTAVISAQSATVSSRIATYTIAADTLASYDYEEAWRVEWTITLQDATVLYPRNDAALVRRGLWPVVTDVDIIRRVPSLDAAKGVSPRPDYQSFLDEAWTEIQLYLIGRGNRPNLVLEPSALRGPHLSLTLALVYEDLRTRLNDNYAQDQRVQLSEFYATEAKRYRDAFDAWMSGFSPRYDSTDSGQADLDRRAMPTVWLNSRSGGLA